MIGEPPQGSGKLRVAKRHGTCAQRGGGFCIQLFCNDFAERHRPTAGLHADLDSSKFPPRALKYLDESRNALPNQAGGGAGRSDEGEFGQVGVDDVDLRGEGGRQGLPQLPQNREFALATVEKTGQSRFGRQNVS